MTSLGIAATGVLDQLNPFSLGNLILYFAWLIIFTFTGIAVWRSGIPWLRLICFLVNQVVSVGVLLSWTLTGLLAYTYWWESVSVFAATAAGSLYLFRTRKRLLA
ncbi:hypothetical protein [Rhodospirillaceae bacterium SYSU D60014]|uniref:hypothetical protein n=1 Tax=Virgifigura deserti TaxID=2268457 RepID=UPI000E6696DB